MPWWAAPGTNNIIANILRSRKHTVLTRISKNTVETVEIVETVETVERIERIERVRLLRNYIILTWILTPEWQPLS